MKLYKAFNLTLIHVKTTVFFLLSSTIKLQLHTKLTSYLIQLFKLNYLLKQKHFESKTMLEKLLRIYHSLTMEVSLLQIINAKKLTKIACSSRVVVQYVNRKILQFYIGFFIIYYQMKALKIK